MVARLITSLDPRNPHRLCLPDGEGAGTLHEELRYGLPEVTCQGPVLLEANSWQLDLEDLQTIQALLQTRDLQLCEIRSRCRDTLVAAAALGIEAGWERFREHRIKNPQGGTIPGESLTIHQGTLRSGDHLQAEGSVLLLGDGNPGSRISAGGHVLVWGRLRGVAHAGRHGDRGSRIIAMQLRPLQLRIADVVARGPQECPPEGLAEMAHLAGGTIRIDPAPPHWPLAAGGAGHPGIQ